MVRKGRPSSPSGRGLLCPKSPKTFHLTLQLHAPASYPAAGTWSCLPTYLQFHFTGCVADGEAKFHGGMMTAQAGAINGCVVTKR